MAVSDSGQRHFQYWKQHRTRDHFHCGTTCAHAIAQADASLINESIGSMLGLASGVNFMSSLANFSFKVLWTIGGP